MSDLILHNRSALIKMLEQKSIYLFGCLTCIFIFFQASFAYKEFAVNINFADILAIGAAIILLFEVKKINSIYFTLPNFKLFSLLAISAFCLSFLNGCLINGFSSYAFISKFLGFFVLIGYTAIGGFFKYHYGINGAKLLYKLMISSILTILLIESVIILLHATHMFPGIHITPIFSGYTNNRNAFALQLLCLGVISLIYFTKSDFIAAIVFSATILTYSRSAQITLFITILMLYAKSIIDQKRLYKLIIKIAIMTFGFLGIEFILHILPQLYQLFIGNDGYQLTKFIINHYSYETSNSQRLYTCIESLKLFATHPIFGIGLGGFVKHELLKNEVFLVIHNTFLWILAEFGLIGASPFIWYGIIISKHYYKKIKTNKFIDWANEQKTIFLILIIFISMGNAHEIFYQRILWLILGILLINRDINHIPVTGSNYKN